MYTLEEFDKAKTRILKYIIYKKRTEREVRKKFENEINEELLESVIEYLKEMKYIDDKQYILKIVENLKILKNLSIKEIKHKLIEKGIKTTKIEDYFYENSDELLEYEIKSAKNIILKKQDNMDKSEIKNYLLKKGYKLESIEDAYTMLDE